MHPAVNEEIAEQVGIIDEATDRGISVVRQLLTLARKTDSHLVSIDVNEVISGLGNLLKQTLPKTIDLSFQLRAKLPIVLADRNQITQALLNLCVNARDAMPNGGKLTLRTQIVGGAEIKDDAAQAPEYVCVEVIDTGMGMEDKVRTRIFEPFFTTKEIGEGTGLGLSIVYGIVKNHNGCIDVVSTPERGATFRVYLPVVSPQQRAITDSIDRPQISKKRQHSRQQIVLLVEDEEMMVLLLKKTLEQNGYTVLVALDGEQALNLFDLHKEEIDIVMLDIGLPKKDGGDVVLKMKEEKPDLKVVVSSGYIDPESKAKMYRAGVRDFIEKPYRPAEIVEMLEAVGENT
jgi:two-component system cell cycle sensor histidine kinase/response regulator CckA